MAEIGTIVTAVTGAVGVLRDIGSAAKKVGSSEINERVIDLQQRIIEIQGMLAELIGENEGLRRKLTDLAQSTGLDKELKFDGTVYWKERDGKRADGPFCPHCWDDRKKIAHLICSGNRDSYYCGVCKPITYFYTAEYRTASLDAIPSRSFGFDED